MVLLIFFASKTIFQLLVSLIWLQNNMDDDGKELAGILLMMTSTSSSPIISWRREIEGGYRQQILTSENTPISNPLS